MWILLKKNCKAREVARRPNYFKQWNVAEKLHLEKFLITFKQRTKMEQEVKESLYKKEKGIIEFKKCLRYMLELDNLSQDDFL